MSAPVLTRRGGVYGELAAMPGMVRVAVPGVVGRLVPAMVGLAVLLLVRNAAGGFAAGGLATGGFGLGGAVAAPFAGRAVDVFGARRALPVIAVAFSAACLLLLLAAHARASAAVLVVVSIPVGLLVPPISPFLRTLWLRVTDEPRLQHAGTSLEAALVEVAFLIGPVLAGTLATSVNPSAALLAVVAAALLGSAGVASAPVVRRVAASRQAHAPSGAPTPRAAIGVLLAVIAFATLGFGGIDVAVPAAAARAGHPGLTGPLLALWALGSLMAAVLTGRRHDDRPLGGRVTRVVLTLAGCTVLLPLAPDLAVLGIGLVLAGLGVAPFFVVIYRLAGELSPAGRLTQVSTTMSSAIFAGSAVGNALAGQLVSHLNVHAALALAPLSIGLAAVAALPLQRLVATRPTATNAR